MSKDAYLELALEFKKSKDDKSFTKLYTKMKSSLYHYIFDFVKDKDVAKDLLSDTFIKMYEQINKYDPNKGQITTWAFKIAKNDCLAHIKANRKRINLKNYNQDNYVLNLKEVSSYSEEIKTEENYWDEYNETQRKYNIALNSISDLGVLYKDIIYDRIINKMDYKSIMFKHDKIILKYQKQFENGKISESVYNKEYKKALQRIKNRIKRGRETLGNMILERYKNKYI